jgi:MFS family permease
MSTAVGSAMSYQQKRVWVYLATSAGAYAVYLAIIIGRLQGTPAAHVQYGWVLLWTTLAAIIASTMGRTLAETVSRGDGRRSDVRDREIDRFGEHASRWFIVGGAAAGFLLALLKADYFWIANVIYLGFVLWAVGGSAIKLVAYRRGL